MFKQNLQLTQAYCALRLSNSEASVVTVLRSFNPEIQGKQLFSYEKDLSWYENDLVVWNVDPLSDTYPNLYDELFEQQIAYKSKIITEINSNTEYRGKIWMGNLDETFTDGASEVASEGLIDIYDCPAIDTWFFMTKHNNQRILFAWIPEQFVPLVDTAIAVNALELMEWYEPESSGHYRELGSKRLTFWQLIKSRLL